MSARVGCSFHVHAHPSKQPQYDIASDPKLQAYRTYRMIVSSYINDGKTRLDTGVGGALAYECSDFSRRYAWRRRFDDRVGIPPPEKNCGWIHGRRYPRLFRENSVGTYPLIDVICGLGWDRARG
jgi:hypothetical protein